jgi:flagellar biosynthetic protein FliR
MDNNLARLWDAAWGLTGVPEGGWWISGLVAARVAGLCLTAPITAVPGLDWRFRVLLGAAFIALLLPLIGPVIEVPPVGPDAVWSILAELAAGGLLGWSAALIVAGARQAGDLVASQAGFAATVLLDPTSGDELTPIGRLYGWVGLLVFLSLGGPLVLVEAVAESYRVVPAGGLRLDAEAITGVCQRLGGALVLALRASAPPLVAVGVAGLVLGWVGRFAQGVPVLALSLPLRAFGGIVLVSLGLSALVATLIQTWQVWAWVGGG